MMTVGINMTLNVAVEWVAFLILSGRFRVQTLARKPAILMLFVTPFREMKGGDRFHPNPYDKFTS
jgi:hypothetical protein